MLSVIFKTIITFLAAYAVIDIAMRAFGFFFDASGANDDVFVIIKVRNREKDLEYIVRSIIWKNLSESRGGFVPNVLIVDMGSDDDTPTIARKLADDYSFIYYVTSDEYLSFIEHF